MNAAGTAQLAGVCESLVSGRGRLHLTPSCAPSPAPSVALRSLPEARSAVKLSQFCRLCFSFSAAAPWTQPRACPRQTEVTVDVAGPHEPPAPLRHKPFGLGHVGTLLLIGGCACSSDRASRVLYFRAVDETPECAAPERDD